MRNLPGTTQIIVLLFLAPMFVSASFAQDVSTRGPFEIKEVFPGFSEVKNIDRPIYLTAPNNEGNRLYLMTQPGRIFSFPNKSNLEENDIVEVLDIREKVEDHTEGGNEQGLLGLAFHPNVSENNKVYLDYNAADGSRRNVVSEWTIDFDTGKIDPDSERVLMEFPQPYGNHNGGHLAFGPDGYLYITRGDGGAGGDPKNNGQDPTTLLGAISRIDVDRKEDGKPYAIPDGNPFVNETEKRSEIYAYGLRNVWRFSFDEKTGRLWAGDVGQNKYEEVDIIRKGGNYGWNAKEGFHTFDDSKTANTQLIDPVYEYPQPNVADDNDEPFIGQSVTGGYVYRGKQIPSLIGKYVFGDYASGGIWAIQYDDDTGKTNVRRIGTVPALASFGEDRQNELYICSYKNDTIYKLVPKK